jgi:hypothetical protein
VRKASSVVGLELSGGSGGKKVYCPNTFLRRGINKVVSYRIVIAILNICLAIPIGPGRRKTTLTCSCSSNFLNPLTLNDK